MKLLEIYFHDPKVNPEKSKTSYSPVAIVVNHIVEIEMWQPAPTWQIRIVMGDEKDWALDFASQEEAMMCFKNITDFIHSEPDNMVLEIKLNCLD